MKTKSAKKLLLSRRHLPRRLPRQRKWRRRAKKVLTMTLLVVKRRNQTQMRRKMKMK